MKKTIVSLAFLLLSLPVFATDLTARINTDTVVEGDSFQLILTTDGAGASPNLTPLNADFEVLGTSQNSSVSIINGNMTHSVQWVITLAPKKQGTLTIPPIAAGQTSSQALTITVIDVANVPKNQGAAQGINVIARINGNGDTFYPFQEIPLTVRIETDKPFQQAALIAPNSSTAELSQNGQDRQSQLTQNGRVINIIERDYILRPQSAGDLELAPFVLKGSIADGRRRDPFDDFFAGSPFGGRLGQGKPFSVRSNPLALSVLGKPMSNDSEWFLPAKAVELSAEWQPTNPTFKQGEAVTRIVRLQALGARAEQLPKLTFDNVNGAKIYVDNDKTAMQNSANGTQALREVTLSIVPTQGGEITLPAVSVKWLNTETNETVTSVLPAEVIQVIGDTPPQKPNMAHTEKAIDTQTQTEPPQTAAVSAVWLGFAVSIGLLVCIGGVLWFRRRYRIQQTAAKNQQMYKIDIRKQIKNAISDNNAQALYQTLLTWQRGGASETDTVRQIKIQLEQSLYRNTPSSAGDVQTLGRQLLLEWKKQSGQSPLNEHSVLPPLYAKIR